MNTDFLRSQLRMSGWFLTQALADITHEDSLRPTATGQTINWLVGHLADARGGALALRSGLGRVVQGRSGRGRHWYDLIRTTCAGATVTGA